MVEIFKIFLPCTIRARYICPLEMQVNMVVDIFFCFETTKPMWADAFIVFWWIGAIVHWWIFSKSVGTLVPKVSLSSFCYIKQLYLSRKTSKTTTRKATREKKTSDADASVSDTLTLIGGYLNDHEIQSYRSLALHLLNICCIATRLENFFPGYNGEEFMSKVYIYIYMLTGFMGFVSLYIE